MDAILTGIVQAVFYFLDLEVILLVFAGVLLGLTIGVIPGLGGLATLALLLPFAYGMDPVPALALILGAYSDVLTVRRDGDRLHVIPGFVAPERGAAVLVEEVDLVVVRAGSDVLPVSRDSN